MVGSKETKPLSAAAAVVRNPLSVIAMFVLLVEAIATITLVQVRNHQDIAVPLVWFVVVFPTLIAVLFFGTLWRGHQYLYSPMEFRSDESFLTAMRRLESLEIRQEAAEIDPRTSDEAQSMQVVDRLIELGDIRTAVKVGRTFLKAESFEAAVRIFLHIVKKTPEEHGARYNAYANLGYAQIGLGKYKDAIFDLQKCLELMGENNAFPWHYMALAYANFKLSIKAKDSFDEKFRYYISKAKKHKYFQKDVGFYKKLYKDMARHI